MSLHNSLLKHIPFYLILVFLTNDIWGNEPSTPIQLHSMRAPINQEESNTVQTVIENQVNALRSGDIPRAYFAFTAKEFRRVTPLEDFKKFINNFSAFSNNQTIDSKNINVNKNMAVVQSSLTGKDGKGIEVQYELAQEDGEWKIMGIQVVGLPSKIAK